MCVFSYPTNPNFVCQPCNFNSNLVNESAYIARKVRAATEKNATLPEGVKL